MARKGLSRGKGRGPRITDEELDRMVALYQQGKSLGAIGREMKRNPQTVRKYVVVALKERPGQELHREALKEALVGHYRDMVEALASLRELLKLPEFGKLVSYSDIEEAIPDIRIKLLLDALREEHAKDSPLWTWRDRWNEVRDSFARKFPAIDERLDAEIGVFRTSAAKATLVKGLAGVMTQQVMSVIVGSPLYDISMLRVIPSNIGEGEELWLGQTFMLASGMGMQELKTEFEKFMKNIPEWEEVEDAANLYKEMAELRKKIEEEVEVLRLRRAFPGHCRLCPV